MTRTIHRWANTLAILIVMYFLYQISVSSEEKDVKQCEYLLMEELGTNKMIVLIPNFINLVYKAYKV